MPDDIKYIIEELGSNMLLLANKVSNLEEGKKLIIENLQNGKGYDKFKELVEAQGGDISYLENTEKFEKAKYIVPIKANKTGKIVKLDCLKVRKTSFIFRSRQREKGR